MMELSDNIELERLISHSPGVLVLWGGKACGVCHAIKPRIEALVNNYFPQLKMVYIDCQRDSELCSQRGVFTLPTVQVYLEGQRFVEEVRAFSLHQLKERLERPYRLLF